MISTSRTHFNSRSREGSDQERGKLCFYSIVVSIHAPVKGATSHSNSSNRFQFGFNSRSREGSDELGRRLILVRILFQFTLP